LRSATIFSFAGAKRHLANYYPRHPVEISHFIKRLNETNLFEISGFHPTNPERDGIALSPLANL
jgi:hypothetical protein